jgi:hypothetical protein
MLYARPMIHEILESDRNQNSCLHGSIDEFCPNRCCTIDQLHELDPTTHLAKLTQGACPPQL